MKSTGSISLEAKTNERRKGAAMEFCSDFHRRFPAKNYEERWPDDFFAWNDFSWMYWEETNREIASPTPNFFHLVDASISSNDRPISGGQGVDHR